MPIFWLLLIVVGISLGGFVAGRQRALRSAGDARTLHSLPFYYGANALMKSVVPGVGVVLLWLLVQPLFIDRVVSGMIADTDIRDGSSRGLVMSEVRRTADGLDAAVAAGVVQEATSRNPDADVEAITQSLKDAGQVVTSTVTRSVLNAAQTYRAMAERSNLAMSVAAIFVALAGAAWGAMQASPVFRARNIVEQGIMALLIASASVAILTTVGIVL